MQRGQTRSFYLSDEMYEKLKATSRVAGISMGTLLTKAFYDYIGIDEKDLIRKQFSESNHSAIQEVVQQKASITKFKKLFSSSRRVKPKLNVFDWGEKMPRTAGPNGLSEYVRIFRYEELPTNVAQTAMIYVRRSHKTWEKLEAYVKGTPWYYGVEKNLIDISGVFNLSPMDFILLACETAVDLLRFDEEFYLGLVDHYQFALKVAGVENERIEEYIEGFRLLQEAGEV